MGFHGSNLSPGQIFGVVSGVHDLPEICAANGWVLMAPDGIYTSNMANVASQTALEVDLALVAGVVGFNRDKVYSLGFSMGGLNATSFAFRHQDPYAIRTAGIIHHTGTVDIIRDYNEASPFAKVAIWENPLVFGASPTANPFAYNRVNPARFDGTGTDFVEELFQLDALKHTPFYLHYDTNDPLKYWLWNALLKDALTAKGFTFEALITSNPQPAHSIYSLDFHAAVGYVTQHPLGPLPASAEIFADRPAQYLWSRLVTDPAPNVARYTVAIDAPTNSFTVSDTHHVGTLAFNLDLMGLDPAQQVTFTSTSGDSTSDTYVLTGYPAQPASILVGIEGAMPFATSYDSIKGEVSITPNETGLSALVQVVP
jgi:dienelactone hydrolase